jgi:hypothetical protein
MTHGRPAMVSASWVVDSPLMIDDEYLLEEGEGSQPLDVPSDMCLFSYTTKLFDIMEEVLSTFYYRQTQLFFNDQPHLDAQTSERFSNVLKIEAKLNQFRDDLPNVLRQEALIEWQRELWYKKMLMQSSIIRSR